MPRLGAFLILTFCASECIVDSRLLRTRGTFYDEPLFRTSYREPSVYLRGSSLGFGRSSPSLTTRRRIQSGRSYDLGFSEFPSVRHRTSLHSLYNERNGQLGADRTSREVLGHSVRASQHHQNARLNSGLRRVYEPRANVASVLDTLRQRQTIPSSREVLGHSQRTFQPNHNGRHSSHLLQVKEPRKLIARVSISTKATSGKTSKEVLGQPAQWERQAAAQPADIGKMFDLIKEQRKQQNKLIEQKQKSLQKQQELVHKSLQKQQEQIQKMLKKELEQQQKQQQAKLTSKEVIGLW